MGEGAGCRWVIWGRGLDVGGLYGGGGWKVGYMGEGLDVGGLYGGGGWM